MEVLAPRSRLFFDPLVQNRMGGGGGISKFVLKFESNFFCYLGAIAKFQKPTITLSGRQVTTGEERNEMKNTVNSGHLAPPAQ